MKDTNNKIVLTAPQAELNAFIAIGTSTAATTTASTLGDGLVAHWKMNEHTGDGTVADSTGNNTGEATGNTEDLSVAGKISTALDFSGGNKYVLVSSPTNLPLGNSPSTMSAWVYVKGVSDGNAQDVVTYGPGSPNSARLLSLGDGSKISMGFYANDYAANNVMTYNEWTLVTATYDGTTGRVYKNGAEVGNQVFTDVDTQAGGDFRIADSNWNSAAENFNGYIDDVRVYNRALTPAEISELYNGGAGTEGE